LIGAVLVDTVLVGTAPVESVLVVITVPPVLP
jgi:hypothetical protein